MLYYHDKHRGGYCKRCKPWDVDHNHFTGKIIWLGSEVYGDKLGSDQLREDTENAMLGGSGVGLG